MATKKKIPTSKTAKKSTSRTSTKKKTTKKTSSRKKTTKKKVTKRKTAKKSPARKKTTKKTSTRKTTKKAPARKKSTKKKTSARKTKCTKKGCAKKNCAHRQPTGGHSLVDRARECRDLEECRKFIIEMGEALEQSNDWLNEMHDQALSAENARDLYGEQISDLVEAVDADQKRITQLQAELKKARETSGSGASETVLRNLAALSKEVKTIRSDLKRLLQGRQPTSERRRTVRQTKKQNAKFERAEDRATSRGRGRRDVTPGPFAKYSVLRGAACSLGVGKHGYPPEVCAPAHFPRPVAAEILGTYAQNDYGGLARWALVTGLPIDDVRIPAVPTKAAGRKAPKKTSRKKASTSPPRRGKSSKAPKKPHATKASSSQVLDQVLLTIARI